MVFSNLKLINDETQQLIVSHIPNEKNSVRLLDHQIIINSTGPLNQLHNQLTSTLFMLRQLKTVNSFDIIKVVYYSFFHYRMTYGIVLWKKFISIGKSFLYAKESNQNISEC